VKKSIKKPTDKTLASDKFAENMIEDIKKAEEKVQKIRSGLIEKQQRDGLIVKELKSIEESYPKEPISVTEKVSEYSAVSYVKVNVGSEIHYGNFVSELINDDNIEWDTDEYHDLGFNNINLVGRLQRDKIQGLEIRVCFLKIGTLYCYEDHSTDVDRDLSEARDILKKHGFVKKTIKRILEKIGG
jgi:hypothetical protein